MRWVVLTTFSPPGQVPWPVLGVNVAGSVVLGAALAAPGNGRDPSSTARDVVSVGFCGGLTTFSTVTVEVVHLARHADTLTAVSYGMLSVASAVAAVALGVAVAGRRSRSTGPP